ncbi:MAG: TlyA family RNA methyltransferase [Mycoplasma sp.]
MRLDLYLVNEKLASTRNEAMKLIKNGYVLVNDIVINKNSFDITNQSVSVIDKLKYVSRAGEKLEFALDEFGIDVNGFVVLDIGTSTGGFADVCLQRNIDSIFCTDVGTDQIHKKIKSNKKVTNIENCNVKDLNKSIITKTIDLVISDLSFISSKYMFDALKNISLKNGANIISLIKPQFELGKVVANNSKGIISDKKMHDQAIANVCSFAKENNFKIMKIIESPIVGAKKKNKEFLIWCKYEQ